MRHVHAALALVVTVLCVSAPAYAQVARVLRIDGAAMVDHVGQKRRFLGIGEQLDERAVITVAKESFVMLEFRDETRVTLRPNTVFRVESYADQTPESVQFGLAKGGLRAISGLVGKRKPEVVQINTTSAYIGIRGTEFDARLCELDCQAEDRAATSSSGGRAAIAARVVEIGGIAVATGATLPTRMLIPGAIIYERDTVATAPAAYVTLAFPDGSRASIGSASVLAVQQFRLDAARPEQNAAQFRLLEGSVRIMTGAIAQRRPEAYSVETAIASLEPHGKLVDALCTGRCVDSKSNARAELQRMKEQAERSIAQANTEAGVVRTAAAPPALAPAAGVDEGLVVYASEGAVFVGSGEGRVEVPQGSTATFSERAAPPRFATQTLAYVTQNNAPRPELVTVDPALFDADKAQRYDPGLYVWVRDGAITLRPTGLASAPAAVDGVRLAAAGAPPPIDLGRLLQSGPVIVEAGQSAFITPQQVTLLPAVPTFMRFDATPLPTRTNVPSNLPFFRARDGSTVGLCTP